MASLSAIVRVAGLLLTITWPAVLSCGLSQVRCAPFLLANWLSAGLSSNTILSDAFRRRDGMQQGAVSFQYDDVSSRDPEFPSILTTCCKIHLDLHKCAIVPSPFCWLKFLQCTMTI